MTKDEGSTERLLVETMTPRSDLLLALWADRSACCPLPERGSVVIGRAKECALVVDHTSVSREHARVDTEGRLANITDLGSSNGTRVFGRALARGEAAALTPGVLIEIGVALLVVQRGCGALSGPPPRAASRDRKPEGVFVPDDGSMTQVYRLVEHFAGSRLTVLLLGETGVGKEIVAEAVHRFSSRARGPFVGINCAALPEGVLENELFGHEKGAFSGAVASKAGIIESADGGTLFLDEVGELTLATQAKLLRVLESREVQRLGSVRPRRIDIRVVAATNRDLEAAVGAGMFRLDLFHRLDGVSIAIPPLRARRNEIGQLARLFVRRTCTELGCPLVEISDAALAVLMEQSWPGNIRELRNAIERAVVLAGAGPIEEEHLRLRVGATLPSTPSLVPAVAAQEGEADDERLRLVDALARFGGNQSRVARELRLSRRTLLRRLDEYGLPRPRKAK